MNGDPRKSGGAPSPPLPPSCPLPAPPLKGPEEEVRFRELMDEESPDGRPPSGPVKRESRILFWTVYILVIVAVVSALTWRSGSIVPGLIALLLMLVFIGLAAWPTWHAAVDRKIEERHVAEEIKEGGGPAGHPT